MQACHVFRAAPFDNMSFLQTHRKKQSKKVSINIVLMEFIDTFATELIQAYKKMNRYYLHTAISTTATTSINTCGTARCTSTTNTLRG